MDADRLVQARGGGYRSLHDLWRRTGLGPAALETLAKADAFGSLGLDRRRALWQLHALEDGQLPLFDLEEPTTAQGWPAHIPAADLAAPLPAMTLGEQVVEDYGATGLSLRAHPLKLLRPRLQPLKIVPSAALARARNNGRVKVAGLVLVRQRPGTASGVIFMTLEDETGVTNIVVWPKVFEQFRRVVLGARLLAVDGKLQREGLVIHVIAERVLDLSHLLGELGDENGGEGDAWGRAVARADEVKRATTGDQRLMRLRSRDFH
jgi:error-prone DNA polymerase